MTMHEFPLVEKELGHPIAQLQPLIRWAHLAIQVGTIVC